MLKEDKLPQTSHLLNWTIRLILVFLIVEYFFQSMFLNYLPFPGMGTIANVRLGSPSSLGYKESPSLGGYVCDFELLPIILNEAINSILILELNCYSIIMRCE